jgi:hypothetical protein
MIASGPAAFAMSCGSPKTPDPTIEPITRAVRAPSFNFRGVEVVALGMVSIDVALMIPSLSHLRRAAKVEGPGNLRVDFRQSALGGTLTTGDEEGWDGCDRATGT